MNRLVLKLWEGLGYYRRARHLHAAAKLLVAEHEGELPNDPKVWISLPGVGRYIMGAVLSQAFDHRLPIVEANSLRVLARLFGYRGDPREGEGKVWVWLMAEAAVPTQAAGDFNQAVMELGALVCTPTTPQCHRCPLARQCVTNRDNLQSLIPPVRKQPAVTSVREVGVVIRDRNKILICQRPPNATRWQNMWEIPHAEHHGGQDANTGAKRIAKEGSPRSVGGEPGEEVLTVKHSVTRFAITLTCVEVMLRGGTFSSSFYRTARWVTPKGLASYPVSAPQRRLMNSLAKPESRRRLA